jgi:hypothetical protein
MTRPQCTACGEVGDPPTPPSFIFPEGVTPPCAGPAGGYPLPPFGPPRTVSAVGYCMSIARHFVGADLDTAVADDAAQPVDPSKICSQ